MDGRKDGWVEGKAGLRIANSNQKFTLWFQQLDAPKRIGEPRKVKMKRKKRRLEMTPPTTEVVYKVKPRFPVRIATSG